MVKIGASILTADFADMGGAVQKLDEIGVDYFHLDIMDGHFVPQLTFGAKMVEAVRNHTEKLIDVHVMASNPECYIADLADAGADHVTVHVEATQHVHRVIETILEYDMSAGIALNPGTPFVLVEPVLEQVAMVLQMSVDPGYGGQRLLSSTYKNVQKMRQYRDEYALDYQIQMDGGVNRDTIDTCRRVGADWVVAGSAIVNQPDWEKALADLRQELKVQ